MKPNKIIPAIVLCIIIIVGLFIVSGQKQPTQTINIPNENNEVINVTKSNETTSSTPSTYSTYTSEQRAKIRIEFIESCNTKGKYGMPTCNCVADFLSNNYTDKELAKFYTQYHLTNQVPNELQIALDSCTKK